MSVNSTDLRGSVLGNPWTWLKLLVSVGLLAVLASLTGLRQVVDHLRHVDWALAALSVAVLLCRVVLAAYRWSEVAKVFGPHRRLLDFVRFSYVAQFFNQLLPSGFGGDAARTWLYHKRGAKMREALLATIGDRFLGVFALFGLVALTLLINHERLANSRLWLTGLALSMIGVFASWLVLLAGLLPQTWLARWRVTRLGSDLSNGLRRLLFSLASGPKVIGLSVLVHLISVFAVSLLARAVGLSVDVGLLFVAVPVSLLAATIPISIGGWGLREGALVAILAAQGANADLALALSLLFGLSLVAVGATGAAVWVNIRLQVPNGDVDHG